MVKLILCVLWLHRSVPSTKFVTHAPDLTFCRSLQDDSVSDRYKTLKYVSTSISSPRFTAVLILTFPVPFYLPFECIQLTVTVGWLAAEYVDERSCDAIFYEVQVTYPFLLSTAIISSSVLNVNARPEIIFRILVYVKMVSNLRN